MPASCLPDECFCEALHSGLVRQPANMWSSFAFVVVAILTLARPRVRSALGLHHAALLSFALIATGLGSAWYHASLTFAGQVLDVTGMYLIATFLILHRLASRIPAGPGVVVAIHAVVNALLLAIQIWLPPARRVVFAAILAGAIILEAKSPARGRGFLTASVSTMLAGFFFWLLDWSGALCAPDSLAQGHALWHVLGATSAFLLLRRYEEEGGAIA
jgi:hypothetical protein